MKVFLSALCASLMIVPLSFAGGCDKGGCDKDKDKEKKEETVLSACDKSDDCGKCKKDCDKKDDGKADDEKKEGTLAECGKCKKDGDKKDDEKKDDEKKEGVLV